MIKARNQVESSKLLNYDFIKGVLLDSNNYCVYLFNDMEDFSIQELKNIIFSDKKTDVHLKYSTSVSYFCIKL